MKRTIFKDFGADLRHTNLLNVLAKLEALRPCHPGEHHVAAENGQLRAPILATICAEVLVQVHLLGKVIHEELQAEAIVARIQGPLQEVDAMPHNPCWCECQLSARDA